MEAVQDAAAASEEDTIFSGESGANLRISIKDFPLFFALWVFGSGF